MSRQDLLAIFSDVSTWNCLMWLQQLFWLQVLQLLKSSLVTVRVEYK